MLDLEHVRDIPKRYVGIQRCWYSVMHDDQFYDRMRKTAECKIALSDGTHYDIACILYTLACNTFVCVSTNGQEWYYYDGFLWKHDQSMIELRKFMSTVLLPMFEEHHKTPKTISNLKTHTFKKQVIQESVELFYDANFLNQLDADPNLIGFENGVWMLKERQFVQGNRFHCVSLSVGYAYDAHVDDACAQIVHEYFQKLHPNEEQRSYVIQMLSRQLYGDTGFEYMHIHAGVKGKAAGGKTKSFEILHYCLGDYVQKFDVSVLVYSKRKESNAPKPEYKNWKGKRIMYCTEPNPDETLHSGVLKELTGGEQIVYRMLFSNQYDSYIPQFKLHIMTNDLPLIDGADEGVRRRIRVLPYLSTFKPREHVDERDDITQHKFIADTDIAKQFFENKSLRLAYLHMLLNRFDKEWSFQPTSTILHNSSMYLSENNDVERFVELHIEKNDDHFITLQEIKKRCPEKSNVSNLRSRLERCLRVSFLDQKKIKGKVYRSVLIGYAFKC